MFEHEIPHKRNMRDSSLNNNNFSIMCIGHVISYIKAIKI